MNIADKIRILMVLRGIRTAAELARRLKCTPQNLHIKMKRGSFSEKDLRNIANILNCTLSIDFTLNDTGEKI